MDHLDEIAKLYWHFHTLYNTIFSRIFLNPCIVL